MKNTILQEVQNVTDSYPCHLDDKKGLRGVEEDHVPRQEFRFGYSLQYPEILHWLEHREMPNTMNQAVSHRPRPLIRKLGFWAYPNNVGLVRNLLLEGQLKFYSVPTFTGTPPPPSRQKEVLGNCYGSEQL